MQMQNTPQVAQEGFWGEVIHVTPRWLVVQNQAGQQFPIAVDEIGEFLVRWPTTFDALTPQSIVEAVGADLGSNILKTGHIDVFEGADQTLVEFTYTSTLPDPSVISAVNPGYHYLMAAWAMAGQNMLYGFDLPVKPMQLAIPSQLHAVGSFFGLNPLRLAIVGANVVTVVPDETNRITISQVTRGTPNLARKGDVVSVMTRAMGPRSLVASQVVLYKPMPLAQFDPAR
jgi:hypothetical protein